MLLAAGLVSVTTNRWEVRESHAAQM